MKYNFDKIIDRTNSLAVKYARRKQAFGREDVLPMWVADMDFATPDFVLKALRERLEHPILGYTERPKSFFEAYQLWAHQRYHWNVESEWLSFSPGVVAALALAILAYTEPDDKIIIQPPIYPPFFETVQGLGRKLTLNPLKRLDSGKYVMDIEDLKRKIDKKTKLIFLSNPHNPVGRAWTAEELNSLAQICLENNIKIISDDIHADFIYSGYKYTPIASLSEDVANITLIATSPSKTFNIPGLSTSVVVIPNEEMRNKYNEKLKAAHLFLGNIFGNIAFEQVYRNGHTWLDNLLQYLEENVEVATKYINENIKGIKVWRPEATFLLWLDFANTGMKHNEIKYKLINEAKIGFNDGLTFGNCGEYFFRMNIASPRPIVIEALERLKQTFG